MTRKLRSDELTLEAIAPRSTLRACVQRALRASRGGLRAAALAVGLAGVIQLAQGAPFPAVFPLASLYPAGGGDGTHGFVLTGTGDQFEQSGGSVSGADDVNGDGVDDLIIGTLFGTPGPPYGDHRQAGESFIVFGTTAGFPPIVPLESLYPRNGGDGTRGFVLTGIDAYDHAGRSVSAAGDVNGDGVAELIVGAPFGGPGGDALAGESYVVFGSTAGFPPIVPLGTLYPAGGGDGTRGFVLTGIDAYDKSGSSVSAAGDVNGDGVGDLIVGAYDADPRGDLTAGESYVVFGSTAGSPPVVPLGSLYPAGGGDGTRGFVLTGIDTRDFSGFPVSAAGDVNGDGVGDLVIGAQGGSPRGDYAGESYVVFGSTAGFPAVVPLATLYPAGGGDGTRGFVLTGIDAFDLAGIWVSAAGDVNGDGVDDVIVGASEADPGGDSSAGESYVVFGSTAGFPAVVPLASLYPAGGGDGTRGFVLTGVETSDQSGWGVSAAGDVNGDGVGDLIVGAPSADPGGDSEAGASYVVFGSTAGFQAVLPLATLYPAGGGDGTRGFVLTGIDPGDDSGESVSAAGDVNGDGLDDLLIGAPGANSIVGESYVVFGRRSAK